MITFINRNTDPHYNLAFEEYIFNTVKNEDVFLIWKNSPSVICGSFQNIFREVHVPTLMKKQIPILRRISGGGTVYHDEGNLNYSIITGDLGGDYAKPLDIIISALKKLGIDALRGEGSDISVEGKKISGSAQKTACGRTLHHGTLLFSSDLSALRDITEKRKSPDYLSKGTASALSRVGNIKEICSLGYDADEFAQKILSAIAPESSSALSEKEEKEIRRLEEEKYRSENWIWLKNPSFSIERKADLAGKEIGITYSVKKGIIIDINLSGDLAGLKALENALSGSEAAPDKIKKVCEGIMPEHADEIFDILL